MGRGIQRRGNLSINLVACMLERSSSLKVMIENKKEKSTVVLELLVGSCSWLLLSSFHTLLALKLLCM